MFINLAPTLTVGLKVALYKTMQRNVRVLLIKYFLCARSYVEVLTNY